MKSIVLVIYIIFAISAIQCSKNDHAMNGDIEVCFVAGKSIINETPAQDKVLKNTCPEDMLPCDEICCLPNWHCEITDYSIACLPPNDEGFDMPHGPSVSPYPYLKFKSM